MLALLPIFLSLLLNNFNTILGITEDIELPNGKIRGRLLTTEKNNEYYAFQGIPYAAPPVGSLRFQPPTAPPNWSGILNTTSDDRICHQLEMFPDNEELEVELVSSEDCLFLNVFVPNIKNNDQNLPVLVWIHGGGFYEGHSSHTSYGPDYFINYEVIVVSINYRLGPFGFLATGDKVIPGNTGLKDQQFALKWVQNNINLFNGDPQKVTIYGESAGGSAVLYHVVSPSSKNLFRGVISSSGSPLNPQAFQPDPRKYAFKTAGYLNDSFNNSNKTSEELLEFLQSVSDQDLLDAAKKVIREDNFIDNFQPFNGYFYAPVIEVENENAFLTNRIFEVFQNGSGNNVPILIGYNSEESLPVDEDDQSYFTKIYTMLDQQPETLVPISMNIEDNTTKLEVATQIKLQYCGTNCSFVDNMTAGIKFSGDVLVTKGVLKTIQLQSKFSDIYMYVFSYFGPLGQWNITVPGAEKVSHFADIFYVFHVDGIQAADYPSNDIKTQDRLLTLWTNFVKYLNPTPDPQDELLEKIVWPKVNVQDGKPLQYLDIDEHLVVKENPKGVEFQFWNELFDKYGQPPYNTY